MADSIETSEKIVVMIPDAIVQKAADANPDLPYAFVKDMLIGKRESELGLCSEFQFG